MAVRPIIASAGFFGAWFVRELFSLRTALPMLDRIFQAVMVATAALAASTVLSGNRMLTAASLVVLILAAQVCFVTGAIAVRRGRAGGLPVMVGSGSVAIGGLIISLGFTDPSAISLAATREHGCVACLAEAAAFLVAIGVRIEHIRKQQ
ncbi:MAG: 7TM diverse intracellular signaling domain-containing protein [Pseudomonadota bacterium]